MTILRLVTFIFGIFFVCWSTIYEIYGTQFSSDSTEVIVVEPKPHLAVIPFPSTLPMSLSLEVKEFDHNNLSPLQGNFDQATFEFDRKLLQNILHSIATIYIKQNDYKKTTEWFSKFLNINGNNLDFYIQHIQRIITVNASARRVRKSITGRPLDFLALRSFSLQLVEYQLLGDKIYATSEINDISYILHHPYRDLAVFDVDDTLITSIHPYFDVHYWPNTALNQRLAACSKAIRDRFFFGVLASNPFVLREPQTPQLVANLQSSGMKVIALTALQPYINKEVNLNIPNWRVQHLRTFGYDFSKSFPTPLVFGFDSSNSQDVLEPHFEKGVMFANCISKGKALLAFLGTMSFKPKSVLFVDDNFDNVCSVYRELRLAGINCHAVLYTRAHKHPSNSLFSEQEYHHHLQKQVMMIEELLQLELNQNY